MKYKSILLILLSFLLVSTCSQPSQSISLQGGYTATLELAGDQYLRKLAGKNLSSEVRSAIEKTASLHETGKADWINLFSQSISEEVQLANSFYGKDNGLDFQASNEEVIIWLREQFDEALQSTFETIRVRVDAYGIAQPMIAIDRAAGQIKLELPGLENHRRFMNMLVQSGELGFWRTTRRSEIYRTMERVNEWSRTIFPVDSARIPQPADMWGLTEEQKKEKFIVENPLLGVFNMDFYLDPERSTFAYAAAEDTARINAILRGAKKKKMLEGYQLLWMAKAEPMMDDQLPLLGLVCIRPNENGGPEMNGQAINGAKMNFATSTNVPVVSIAMNSRGAEEWARLTREETGREIAITLDDKVLTAPRVQGAIMGGRSEISGNFTLEEARDLAAVLNAGSLTAPMRLISEQVIELQTIKK